MNAMPKSVTLAGAVVLALTFAACGGGGGGGCAENPLGPGCVSSPTPTPPIVETVVIYENNGPVAAESGGYLEFAIPSAGTVEATVDWTFASNPVWIALTAASCDDGEAAFLGSCAQIGNPNLGTTKPKRVSGSVSQAGRGRLWLINAGPVDESMAVQITITRTRGASVSMVLDRSAWTWVPAASAAVRAVRAFEK